MIFGSSPQAEVGSTGLNGAPAEGKADPSHSTHTWYLLGKGEQDKKNVPQVSSTAKSGAAGMAAPPLQQGEGMGDGGGHSALWLSRTSVMFALDSGAVV